MRSSLLAIFPLFFGCKRVVVFGILQVEGSSEFLQMFQNSNQNIRTFIKANFPSRVSTLKDLHKFSPHIPVVDFRISLNGFVLPSFFPLKKEPLRFAAIHPPLCRNGILALTLRGGYTPKNGKKSKSKRKPLSLKYKILKRIRAVSPGR